MRYRPALHGVRPEFPAVFLVKPQGAGSFLPQESHPAWKATAYSAAETLSLLDEVRYDSLFSFKYSPRPNTPSLSMPDAIPEEEKSRRLAVLQEKQRGIQGERHAMLVGTAFDVFVSGKSRRENQWSGHTSCHRVVNFTSQRRELLGTYVQGLVTGAGPNSLGGAQGTQPKGAPDGGEMKIPGALIDPAPTT